MIVVLYSICSYCIYLLILIFKFLVLPTLRGLLTPPSQTYIDGVVIERNVLKKKKTEIRLLKLLQQRQNLPQTKDPRAQKNFGLLQSRG